jgi:hypothetical protein
MDHPTPHTIAALIWGAMLAVKAVGMARRWQQHRAKALSRAFGRELRRRLATGDLGLAQDPASRPVGECLEG